MSAWRRRGRTLRTYRAGAGACLLVLAGYTWPDAAAHAEPVGAGDTHRLRLESADGRYGMRFGARLQYDVSEYRADDSLPMGGGTNPRRARLSADAKLPSDWSARVAYDFSRDGIEGFRDVFLRLQREPSTRITAGHFKEPFGMERLSGVRDLPFMERSLASLLTPPRTGGVEAQVRGTHWTATAGGFGRGVEGGATNVGHGVSGRATFAPLNETGRILHLGAGIAHRWIDADKALRFRQRPESRTTATRLVDTGVIRVEAFTYYGTELAGARGPVSFQAEYIIAHVDRGAREENLRFRGWYAQSSWFITGEPHAYDKEKATFGRMRPARSLRDGSGAWQLAARLSQLDLTDRDIIGGRETNWTYALSWYPNSAVRVIFEYLHVEVDGGRFDGARPRILQARMQLAL